MISIEWKELCQKTTMADEACVNPSGSGFPCSVYQNILLLLRYTSNFQWSNVSIICINMLWLPLCFFRCISQLSHSKHNTTLHLSLTLTFILPFTKITDSSIRSEHSQSHFSPITNNIIISSYYYQFNLKWSAF